MNTKRKKWISIALTIMMVLTMLPTNALTAIAGTTTRANAVPTAVVAANETAEESAEAVKTDADAAAMPAARFRGYTRTVEVTVDAPEGAFPAGTKMKLADVRTSEVEGAVKNALGNDAQKLRAVDITFVDAEGNKIEPAKDINVVISSPEIKEAGYSLVHIPDQGAAEVVSGANVQNAKVSFESDQFSIYVVVESGEDARLAVNFVQANGNTKTMLINKRQADTHIEPYIYDPGVGEMPEGAIFKGWTTEQNYTDKTTALTIADVRAAVRQQVDAGITDGASVTYYAMVFMPHTVTYLDERGVLVKTDLTLLRTNVTEKPTYEISLDYTPYPTDEEGVAADFLGWQQLKPEVPGEMVLYVPGKEGQNTLTLFESEYVLKAYTEKGFWLSFDENLTNATYTEPQFIARGGKPTLPTPPTRTGYTFDGWYTGDASSARDGQVTGTEFDFTTPLTSNTVVYAKWNKATKADYSVVIWFQNAEGTGYNYSGTTVTVSNATVGNNTTAITVSGDGNDRYARINGENYNKFTGFHLSTSIPESSTTKGFEDPKPVAAEGNTVINVYSGF